jgi:glucose-6-phosphate 1-dehydrogenase
MDKPQSCVLVIFGASGDLTKRKLVPALFSLFEQNLLPEKFAILGVGRTSFDDESFRKYICENLKTFTKLEKIDELTEKQFIQNFYFCSIDTNSIPEYLKIKQKLTAIVSDYDIDRNFLFYLSSPPSLYERIVAGLGTCDLQKEETYQHNWKRLVVEKPFGQDLDSAKTLNKNLLKVFREKQVYRIDHYLGKETVQNILALRFSNGIFEPLWNRNYINYVEITAAEQLGVENRGGYYDQIGALRDMVQNHLLQLLGTIAIEPPGSFDPQSVRNEMVKIFRSLQEITPSKVSQFSIRGQYMEGHLNGNSLKGYRQEDGVNSNSRTETFAAVKVYVDSWRWSGVPFIIRTGKRMPTRVTEVAINFKPAPHFLFAKDNPNYQAPNRLILRIQPDEGMLLNFGMKSPGSGFQIKNVGMDFHYSDLSNDRLPDSYERLLLDALLGDATLFYRGDAAEECWSFVQPILDSWNNGETPLYGYPAATWGPIESARLLKGYESDWRYPCKNITSHDKFCEL